VRNPLNAAQLQLELLERHAGQEILGREGQEDSDRGRRIAVDPRNRCYSGR
jgi:hypothetical protein